MSYVFSGWAVVPAVVLLRVTSWAMSKVQSASRRRTMCLLTLALAPYIAITGVYWGAGWGDNLLTYLDDEPPWPTQALVVLAIAYCPLGPVASFLLPFPAMLEAWLFPESNNLSVSVIILIWACGPWIVALGGLYQGLQALRHLRRPAAEDAQLNFEFDGVDPAMGPSRNPKPSKKSNSS